jgi:alpha-tubulin suppressor-like RCC1 family protein
MLGVACADDPAQPTDPMAPPPTASLATLATTADGTLLNFRQVSAFSGHTCGVTPEYQAFCWGYNVQGQLGDGSRTRRLEPVAVVGGHRFRQVSVGVSHTCGVTPADRVFCWGENSSGQLGDGTTTARPMPVRVSSAIEFREVVTGTNHTCAIASDDSAYCWGDNGVGQLGGGSAGADRPTPSAVAGGLHFRHLTSGSIHSCGVTTDDRIYCWGSNSAGQLGDGTGMNRPAAVAVVGGLAFAEVAAGTGHTCGVTVEKLAYCWGDNSFGAIGDGTSGNERLEPAAVAGGFRFRQVEGGMWHTCGITTAERTKCWGRNESGQLGNGTTATRLTPSAVDGAGLAFRQISAGAAYTCGVISDDTGYCWGGNSEGELGDGTTIRRLVPVPLGREASGPPAAFAAVRLGTSFFTSEQNFTTDPAVDTVAVGGTVTWTWTSQVIRHSVQSIRSPSFASSDLMAGRGLTYSVTFATAGIYQYDCIRHPGMTGRIVVR